MVDDTMTDPLRRRFEGEMLALIAEQEWLIPVSVMVAAVLMAWLARQSAPGWLVVGWPLAVALQLAVRQAGTEWLSKTDDLSLRVKLWLSTALSAYGGLTHGAALLLWPYLSDLERTVFSMFLLGLSSGAIGAVMGYLPMYLAYVVPMMVPLAYCWISVLSSQAGVQWGAAMAALFVVYYGMLITLARDTFRHYRHSHEGRYRMQRALDEADAANRAKTRFLASASHDLRQPMHTLTLFGAALSMAPLDERTQRIATQMNVALQALGSQLDALLDVSKLDAGVVPVQLSTLCLQRFLTRVAEGFSEQAARKGLHLSVDAPPDLMVEVDEMLLERVLRNLADNALKYTASGEVRFGAARQDKHVALWVQDTGMGISPEEHDRIFDEFYQIGNPERDREQGLGLGLAIVKRLAQLMAWPISLESLPGLGTRFTLTLPLASRAQAPADAVAMPNRSDVVGLQVLVIDDEENVREGMATLLESLGCQPFLASGIEGALAIAAASKVDIVLADFRLRGDEDGITAIRRLRVDHPGLAALLVSGDTAPQRLREADAADIVMLHKPVQVSLLTQAIRAQVDLALSMNQGQ
jgi:signal transduction histidine kinase/ActR/RegA family two-component response regulator